MVQSYQPPQSNAQHTQLFSQDWTSQLKVNRNVAHARLHAGQQRPDAINVVVLGQAVNRAARSKGRHQRAELLAE